MTCLFWICTGLLAYTFAGYQVLITLLARVRRRRAMPGGGAMASACVLIVAHNEEARIGARIANVREGEPDIEVIVVSDGSMDGTAAAAREAGARVIEFAEKRGKAACLSEVAPGLGCDVIVLTDCRQKFTRETTGKLLRHFADAGIGAVSGILRIGGGTAAGEGVGTYWKLETAVRQAESDFDSCVGCTGAVYAVRRECFRPIPADTILDDVVIPMHVVTAGRRVIYDGAAEAYDPQSLDPALEQRRKARTLAGNFQMMVRYPGWMLPWRNRLAFQLIILLRTLGTRQDVAFQQVIIRHG